MTQENYDRKMQDLKSSIKNPSATDQELIARVDRIHTWMDFTKFDGDRLNTDFIVSLGREMRALYSRIFSNEFSTEEDLLEAYENDLSEEAKEVFWGYEVVNDWEDRQISNEDYEEYIEILEKPYFTEDELKKAYDKSVNQILYADRSDRMQSLSWVDFRKKYEDRIVKAGFVIEHLLKDTSFRLVYCPVIRDEEWIYSKKKAVWVGQTEITQELFKAVMGWNNIRLKTPKNPVDMVSWYDCIAFCNKLSELLGFQSCYEMSDIKMSYSGLSIISAKVTWDEAANGFRLPTEYEWELFAKAGTQNQWAGTDDDSELGQYAWYSRDSGIKTHPVGEKLPNEWGLYDMSGNVYEWCWDMYDPSDGEERVLRGGSFWNDEDSCRVDYRTGYDADARYDHLGFRICRNFE